MTTCPVCGKGETEEYIGPHEWAGYGDELVLGIRSVSHLACVEKLSERIVQAHFYRLPVIALDVETDEGGVHWIDGMSVAEVLAIIHNDVPAPVYESVPRPVGEGWQQAEAELAALRGRRCETCEEWQGDEWRHDKACPVYFLNEMDRLRGRGADDFPPADFSCNRWTAREEGGND
jgi:hypothetical protein